MVTYNLPFTLVADETTDPHANQEILPVCLRFVDLVLPQDPHIKEFFIGFLHLERAKLMFYQYLVKSWKLCLILPFA